MFTYINNIYIYIYVCVKLYITLLLFIVEHILVLCLVIHVCVGYTYEASVFQRVFLVFIAA